MEFYLNVINDTLKLPHENPAIGIIICKSKSRTIVEYALRSSQMPIGVATYSISPKLPDHYKELLPTTAQIAEKLKCFLKTNRGIRCAQNDGKSKQILRCLSADWQALRMTALV